MDFSTFPAQWEWVALIIGGLAFLMAVQPFLQAIYGRPKIVVYMPEPRKLDSSAVLGCHVVNYPIAGGILGTLCVTRNTAKGLIVLFDIKEKRTASKVYEEWPSLASQVGEPTQRIDLPAGYVPARFGVVTINEGNGIVYPGLVPPGKQKGTQVLADGLYVVDVSVEVGGKVVRRMKKDLVVQTKSPYAYWVNS